MPLTASYNEDGVFVPGSAEKLLHSLHLLCTSDISDVPPYALALVAASYMGQLHIERVLFMSPVKHSKLIYRMVRFFVSLANIQKGCDFCK